MNDNRTINQSDLNYFNMRKFMQLKDARGADPEYFMVSSIQRGVGKTTGVGELFLSTFLETGKKFVCITRNGSTYGHTAAGRYNQAIEILFNGRYAFRERCSKSRAYAEIILRAFDDDGHVDEASCGYCASLHGAGTIKEISSLFSDACWGHIDEFMTLDGRYLDNEVSKFVTVHESLARGGGQSRKYFPIIMTSNNVDITNPYFVELGLTSKIQPDTKLYRGDGFIYRKFYDPSFEKVHNNSGSHRAFKNLKEVNYEDNSWLNSSTALIEKPNNWGRPTYVMTLVYNNKSYGILYYHDVGLWFTSMSYDKDFPLKMSGTMDGNTCNPYIKDSPSYPILKRAIRETKIRFQNSLCKEVAFKCLL